MMKTTSTMMRNILKTAAVAVMFLTATGLNAADLKIIRGPYLQNMKSDEVTIVFETDSNSIAWAEIAPNDGTNFYSYERPRYYDSPLGIKQATNVHAITVTGLKPGTSYRYRVIAKQLLYRKGSDVRLGKTASTNVYNVRNLTFTTFDDKKEETSFAVINDIHQRKGLMTNLLKRTDFEKKEFVVLNGDMLNWCEYNDTIFSGFMNEAIELFAKEKPAVFVRGNHETRGMYSAFVKKYLNPNEPHMYYTFRQGPVFFIVLDTGEDKCDNDPEYYGLSDFDTYRSKQAEWLRTVADDKDFKTARYRVVIGHMPPLVDPDSWHGPNEVLNKFVPILNTMGIDIMLCGHQHSYVFAEPNEKINFPVLVNSNDGVIDVTAKKDKISVNIIDIKGKSRFKKDYLPKSR